MRWINYPTWRKMGKKFVAIGIAILLLVCNVSAIRVGVVVEFPDGGIFKKCLTVAEDTNGYEIMERTGLRIEWSDPGMYGHALCAIEDAGCPSSNCWCSSDYWGFYTLNVREGSWSYSPVGFDGGSSCSEHYCARDREVLGFAYGSFGTKPSLFSFEDICPLPRRREEKTFDITIDPAEPFVSESTKVSVLDKYGDPVPGAEIDVYAGNVGTSKILFSSDTDEWGEVSFALYEEGSYQIRVNAIEFSPPQKYVGLTVTALPITTTSTTSTTTTTTTTTKATKTTTTTTTTTSTTVTKTTIPTTTTTVESPIVTGRATGVLEYGTFAGAFLLIVSLSAYFLYRKRI